MKRLSWYVAYKMLFIFNPSKGALSLQKLTGFCVILIAFCIFVPLLILSITNGFHAFTLNTLEQFYKPYWINTPSPLSSSRIPIPKNDSHINTFFQDYIFITQNTISKPAMLRSYQNSPHGLTYEVVEGKAFPSHGEIVLAENLAYQLQVSLGSYITVTSLNSTSLSPIITHPMLVGGIISFSSAELDSTTAIINASSMPLVFHLKPDTINTVTSTQYKSLVGIANKFSNLPINSLETLPLIKTLKEQKTLLRVALFTISWISFFAIFVTLNTAATTYLKSLGILHIIGLPHTQFFEIFLLKGLIIGVLGLLLGLTLATVVITHIKEIFIVLEDWINALIALGSRIFAIKLDFGYQFRFMPQDIFYTPLIPSKMMISDFLVQTISTLLAVLWATFIPSRQFRAHSVMGVIRNKPEV